jgi:citrate synthase
MKKAEDYIESLVKSSTIEPALFGKYNVKRGLRNADGTGVLVGLTRVSDVHGYIIDESDKISVDGKLYYRGIDVEEIVRAAEKEDRFGFEETIYLLLFGALPDREELAEFSTALNESRVLPEHFIEDVIMKLPSADIMNKLSRSVLALFSYDENPEDMSPPNVLRQSIALIAQFPTILAGAYRAKCHYFDHQSLILHMPESGHSTAESLLAQIRTDQQFTKNEAEILDLCLMLHAEHGGGNNSTFAVHLVSSAATDTYSAITAGINSLKGVKHGGATVKVVQMMEDIIAHLLDWNNDAEIADYLRKILDGDAFDHAGLVYGMGHAVYTKSDPRARLLLEKAKELAAEKGEEAQRELDLYMRIERVFQDVFHERHPDKEICVNVDFYSGFVYKMLGIPTELFTPLFACSRIVGWCAHRLEELISGGRIIRPAYKCVQKHLMYTPLEAR